MGCGMTTAELDSLIVLLPPDVIRQLAHNCPSFRIPLKKIEMRLRREEFFRRFNGTNLRALAQALGVPRSTAYTWLRMLGTHES